MVDTEEKMESLFEAMAQATKPEETYEQVKERYSLAWKDWYYWPMEDDEGQEKARLRLEAIGKELNEKAKQSK